MATLVEEWLDLDSAVDGPAGPLFVGGRYAEYELVMTGGGSPDSNGVTGCAMCTGSRCGSQFIDCGPI